MIKSGQSRKGRIMKKTTAMLLSVCLLTLSILNIVTERGLSSGPPVADAGPNQTANEAQIVQFDGNGSYDPNGKIKSYEWDFDANIDSDGDGNKTNDVAGTGPTPTHIYGDDGVYTVTLTVTDDQDLSDMDMMIVTVKNVAPDGRELLVNGNFSNGTDGWKHSLHGYVRPNSIPPLPPSQHSTSTDNGYLETRVFDGYNQFYQDVKVNTTDLDFRAKFRAVKFSTEGGLVEVKVRMFSKQPPGWSGNPPNSSNLSIIKSLIVGQISWYFRPDYIYKSNITSYWELLGTGPSGWYMLDVNLHDVIIAHVPGINESQVKWLRIWIGTYGESNGFTIGDFDDFSLKKSIIVGPYAGYEGDGLIFTARATDLGSDDLIFTWDWGDGSSLTVKTYFNNGIWTDPYPSPEETYPFTATDSVMHTYGDNGVFTITLKVTDDDGGSTYYMTNVIVNNVAPIIEPLGPLKVDENLLLNLDATSVDPGSDDLTFIWDWGDGTPDIITIYYNDGNAPDPYPSPQGTFPFNATDLVQHIYYNLGVYTINLTVEDDDGGIVMYKKDVTINYGAKLPPILYINVSQDDKDAVLYWKPLSTQGIDHYLIYRSTSQTNFNFNDIWVNTSCDKEIGEPDPIPLRTMWNDTNAILPSNKTNYEEQYYYIIRAVDAHGWTSRTSRTVGKWTKTFPEGVSTFSLPLEPLDNFDIDWYTSNMNAVYIKYMNITTHRWVQHNFGEGSKNNTQMKLDEGYEVKFDSQTTFTFTGMPGAMISYDEVSFGFDTTPNTGDADNLTAIVNSVSGTVTLNWTQPVGINPGDRYLVLRSTSRDGFWYTLDLSYTQLAILPFDVLSYQDIGNATIGTEYYYMIVPFNLSTGERGVSTYTIGVWTEEYLSQYDTFGIPLKLSSNQTADWYCDNIPDTVGINYYIYSQQRWSWHSTRMPEGAYDPILVMTEGYQISTSSTTK
ncbi:MAG: PKD domain-containing protein, partial [Thermoplasmata archaeon]